MIASLLVALGALVVLGKLYWFRIPFAGVSIALAFYSGGIIASRFA